MQTPSTPVFPGAQPEDAPVLPVLPLVGGVVVGGVVVGGVVTHCHPPALNAACSPALKPLQLKDEPGPTYDREAGWNRRIYLHDLLGPSHHCRKQLAGDIRSI